MTEPKNEVWLTVAQVAARMQVSKMTVYRLIESDELASVRVGRSIRIPESGWDAYVRQGGNDSDFTSRYSRA